MAKAKLTPIYVNRVDSNIKDPNGDTYSIKLYPKTLLLGSNTSHKSAVLQSVELALTGAADDVVGRNNVKDPKLLSTLTNAEELSAKAAIFGGDDDVASYTLPQGKRPVHNSQYDDALVNRIVREILHGSSASARKAFLSFSAGSVSRDDVLANMPTQIHAKYNDIAERQQGSEIDKLLAVIKYADRTQRDAAKELRGAQAVLDNGLNNQLDSRPSDADVEKLRVSLADETKGLEAAIAVEALSSVPSLEETQQKLKEAHDAIGQWDAEVWACEQRQLAAAPDPQLERAVDLLSTAVDAGAPNCPACNSLVGTKHLSACRDAYQKSQWALEDAAHDPSLASALSAAESSLQQWEAEAMRLKAVMQTIGTDSIPMLAVRSASEARSRVSAAQSALLSTETARARWDDLARSRDVVATMKKDVATYKELKTVGESTVGILLDARSSSFTERVQVYLPDEWVFGIELRDGKKEVFRMGLRRDDNLHCALSGAEWAALVTAIAAAVREIESQKQLSVLIPEDRAWDARTLAQVMRALSAFPGQVLMASTTKPAGRLPSGWTIVNMDEWSQTTSPSSMPPVEESAPSSTSTEVLKGMGYSTSQIKKLSADSSADIIKKGLLASCVSVLHNGSYQITATVTALS